MAYIDGDDFVTGALLSYQEMIRIKDNWRGATPPANFQPGMTFSRNTDDRFFHQGAAELIELYSKKSGTVLWKKGADIPSQAALAPGADGNYFDVTGVAAITSIAATESQPGTVIRLHFDGILILTYHATDLILPGGANITTAAGDEATFIEYAAGDWRCVCYTKADGTPLVGGGGGISNVVEDLTPQLGGDLDLNGKNIDFPTTPNISDCLDEDDMASNSATKLATQQSIKAYVDNAVKFKIGTFSRDMTAASGNVAYTGVGFTPDYIIVTYSFHIAAGVGAMGTGFSNGTNHYTVIVWLDSSYSDSSTQLIFLRQAADVYQIAFVASWNADGFTLTWTKNGVPSAGTAYIFYIAVKGA